MSTVCCSLPSLALAVSARLCDATWLSRGWHWLEAGCLAVIFGCIFWPLAFFSFCLSFCLSFFFFFFFSLPVRVGVAVRERGSCFFYSCAKNYTPSTKLPAASIQESMKKRNKREMKDGGLDEERNI